MEPGRAKEIARSVKAPEGAELLVERCIEVLLRELAGSGARPTSSARPPGGARRQRGRRR